MSDSEKQVIREGFLAWSGGEPPDSVHEIFSYIEAALPIGIDNEQARLFLKAWMEQAWQENPQIENPMKFFDVFRAN